VFIAAKPVGGLAEDAGHHRDEEAGEGLVLDEAGATAGDALEAPLVLTVEEAHLLQARLTADAAAARQDLPDLVAFLLGTGLRIGEACAVRPCAVDLTTATLTVTGTVIRQPGHGLLIQDVPENTAGRRTIALPPRTVELLRRRLTAPATTEHDAVVRDRFPNTLSDTNRG